MGTISILKNIWIHGIAFDCPYHKRENDCPFLKIGHFSPIEKTKWIKELNIETKRNILYHHAQCSKKRENINCKTVFLMNGI